MAWQIDVVDECAVVRMNTHKVNVQNDQFFADLHEAFDRLEREFQDLPVVLTGHGDVFSAGIDFQYSFDIFGSGSEDKIRQWYRAYRETNLRLFTYPRPSICKTRSKPCAGSRSKPWSSSGDTSWARLRLPRPFYRERNERRNLQPQHSKIPEDGRRQLPARH